MSRRPPRRQKKPSRKALTKATTKKTAKPLPPPVAYVARLPISLCIIAKNEEKNVPRFLANVRLWITHPQDEIVVVDTGSTDKTVAYFKAFGARVIERPDLTDVDLLERGKKLLGPEFEKYGAHEHYKGGLLRSFAEARQLATDAAKNGIVMWLDLDDVVQGFETLRQGVDTVFAEGRRGYIFFKYVYTLSAHGETTTELWRERVFTKGDFHWKGRCHETLIPNTDAQLMAAMDRNCPVVVTHVGAKSHEFSDLRNYMILYDEYFTQGVNDPRSLFYLANAARGLGRNDEAARWYLEFMDKSGNEDDIVASLLSLAGCFSALGQFYKALEACTEVQVVRPREPRAHYMAATIWANLQNWNNAIAEIEKGDSLPPVETLHALEPQMLDFQPAAIAAIAYKELRNPEKAMEYAQKALAARPDVPEVRAQYEDFQRWATAEVIARSTLTALYYSKDKEAAFKTLSISPHLIHRGIGTPEKEAPGDPSKRSIAFWCGTTHEPWGPQSMEIGIGASEKMVYDVSKALAKRGWNVQVYCTLNCEEGEYDGVQWRNTAHFNPRVYRNVLVVWRMPTIVDKMPFACDKLFVWMHDVGRNADWTPEILLLTTKVLFASEFQRHLHPAVPDDKAYVTRNGIDLARQLYQDERKEKKVVYMSSPDRGWQTACEAFAKSGVAKMGYSLHLMYGFGPTWMKQAADRRYGFIPDVGLDQDMYLHMDRCHAMCDGQSIVARGRLGWAAMAKELKTGSIWLYPTRFDEISCVSGMEAMAAGMKIVATKYAALKETLDGYPGLYEVPLGKTRDELIQNAAVELVAAATAPDSALADRVAFARKWDIETLVEQWDKELFDESNA